MKLLPHMNQGSDAWKAWRHAGVGGSDFVALLGLTPPWPPPLPTRADLLAEKVHGREPERTFAMRRGTLKEPAARLAYERRASCVAAPACVESDAAPWMRCSLDGLASNHALIPSQRLFWIVELKVPSWRAHDSALEGFVPDYYRPQMQWQLLVTGLGRLDYVSYSEHGRFAAGDRLAVVRVEPDAAEQARLQDEAARFWLEVLEARERAAKSRPDVEAELA